MMRRPWRQSDLGVAIGSGEKVNIEALDVLVPADDPIIVTELLRVARKCQQVVNQNLIISVGVTAILVASVLLGANEALWINVLIHELSALVVIFNGLQITSASNLTTIIGRILKSLWEETAIAIGFCSQGICPPRATPVEWRSAWHDRGCRLQHRTACDHLPIV